MQNANETQTWKANHCCVCRRQVNYGDYGWNGTRDGLGELEAICTPCRDEYGYGWNESEQIWKQE